VVPWLLALLFLVGVGGLAAFDVWCYAAIRRGLRRRRERARQPLRTGRAAPERSPS
jgi:hypothetical protein